MTEQKLSSSTQSEGASSFDLEAHSNNRQKVMSNLIEKIKPWLLEFGSWIFGGILGFNLVVFASVLLLAAESTSPAIRVSLIAFASTFPINASGLVLLKLLRDMKDVAVEDVMRQAFHDANIPNAEVYLPVSDPDDVQRRRKTNMILSYSLFLAVISAIFTLIGVTAALWFIVWWIGVSFAVVVVINCLLSVNGMMQLVMLDSKFQNQPERFIRKTH